MSRRTTEQLRIFLDAAKSHRLYAYYHLAAYTGARRGELLYLRWQAVDLAAAKVTFGGSTAVVRVAASREQPKAAGPASSASMPKPSPYSANTTVSKPKNARRPEQPGTTMAA